MPLLNGFFCGDNKSFDYTPTSVLGINSVLIKNGIYDEIYGTTNTIDKYTEAEKAWTFNTRFYAKFKENLFGGNVDFAATTVSAMRIKRRKKGEFNWVTMDEIPIYANEDFEFERFDRVARGNTEYEYSLVPVISGMEGNYNVNSIVSNFEGFFLVDKDVAYHANLNVAMTSTERTHNSVTVNTLGRRYPFHISNGSSNYTSGNLQATFIDTDINGNYDIDNAWKFRDQLDDFLTNGEPKILKNHEGKAWMIAVVGNIAQDFSQHWQMPIHTISWAQIGDIDDANDLFDNGLINIDNRLI